ncbi:hypothetical protein Tco_1395647 [Tanacetum coccineum]
MTGMSPTNLKQKPVCPKAGLGESPVRGTGRKPRRIRHGINIKVSTPGSASAGARSTNGKRVSSVPMDDEISKVVDNLKSGAIAKNLKFQLGSSSDCRTTLKADIALDEINGNDGLFIKAPLDSIQRSHVAKSSGLEPSCDNTSKGVGGNSSCYHAGSRDGIAIAKIGIVEGVAGSNSSLEHTSMEDVVSTGVVLTSNLDGIASNKGGYGFEFGKYDQDKGIIKKPISPLFKVQFGENSLINPFGLRYYIDDADRFAEKLKQGSEELALKMKYTPSAVSELENRNNITLFSADEVYKGRQACSLQQYGFFVGMSMDYRVVKVVLRWFKMFPLFLMFGNLVYGWIKLNPLLFQYGCVYNISMELCNGNRIGKIMNEIRNPMVMDKMTKDMCLKKARKLDFARVLVEVSANEELPLVLEIEYPPTGNRHAKVGKLEVKYQWKPPLCTHCKTFGHTTLACKVRPRTEESSWH